MRRFWHRPLGSKLVLVCSLAFLLVTFAPWQRPCAASGAGGENICGWRTAYSGSNFGTYAALLALAILVWELLPVLSPRLSMRGWPTAIVSAILGVALVVCVLVKMIDDNQFQTGWAWIGLALALATMLVALIRVRYRWGIRGRDRAAPAAPSTPQAPPSAPRGPEPDRDVPPG
ncbi:hypothetical protein [Gaiella sp.]|uniref:hypothetical protein n=1 Tax=Gaiella sp. TaxID=2663207 RepID=UPI002E34B0EC|nr:hypothetical protein [Gaiella sp.]HEX5585388.1 hypothetical protein [Gaiella sp.]